MRKQIEMLSKQKENYMIKLLFCFYLPLSFPHIYIYVNVCIKYFCDHAEKIKF